MPTAARRPQGEPPFPIPNCVNLYISTMKRLQFTRCAPFCMALVATCSCGVHAAQSVSLPAWVCAYPDAIFVSHFDTVETPVPHDPTFGSGGNIGTTTHNLH